MCPFYPTLPSFDPKTGKGGFVIPYFRFFLVVSVVADLLLFCGGIPVPRVGVGNRDGRSAVNEGPSVFTAIRIFGVDRDAKALDLAFFGSRRKIEGAFG